MIVFMAMIVAVMVVAVAARRGLKPSLRAVAMPPMVSRMMVPITTRDRKSVV